MDKTEVEILAEEVDEYIKLMRLAVQSIAICPICHKKYVKGQSENGCPYCEIRCLVEDTI